MARLKELAAFGGLFFGLMAMATLGLKAEGWIESVAEEQFGETIRHNQIIVKGVEEDVLHIKYAMKADSARAAETAAKVELILEVLLRVEANGNAGPHE